MTWKTGQITLTTTTQETAVNIHGRWTVRPAAEEGSEITDTQDMADPMLKFVHEINGEPAAKWATQQWQTVANEDDAEGTLDYQ